MGRKMMVLQLLEMEIWIKKLKNIADFSTFSQIQANILTKWKIKLLKEEGNIAK
jgi:hypothetical protein